MDIWHQRLGHPALRTTRSILFSNKLPLSNKKCMDFCTTCPMDKSHKLPFTAHFPNASAPTEIIHIDLWGASPVLSSNGYTCFVF